MFANRLEERLQRVQTFGNGRFLHIIRLGQFPQYKQQRCDVQPRMHEGFGTDVFWAIANCNFQHLNACSVKFMKLFRNLLEPKFTNGIHTWLSGTALAKPRRWKSCTRLFLIQIYSRPCSFPGTWCWQNHFERSCSRGSSRERNPRRCSGNTAFGMVRRRKRVRHFEGFGRTPCIEMILDGQ